MRKLKRVVIKEELVALTGDTTAAIILNQFIYWSERVRDFDKFIEEEKERMAMGGEEVSIEKRNGWIYKKVDELADEIMITKSTKTVRRRIKDLVDAGWLDERNNPNVPWDRTKQYRVNITKIQNDLQNLGYALDGYPLQMPIDTGTECDEDTPSDSVSNATGKNANCNGQDVKCSGQDVNWKGQDVGAIPEITTKTTNKNYNNIDDVVVKKYKSKIDEVTGGHISLSQVISLLKIVGPEQVDKYIELFPLFMKGQNIYNTVGFFIKACLHEYQPPKSSQKEYEFNKFEQHEYDEDDLESLFLDIENM